MIFSYDTTSQGTLFPAEPRQYRTETPKKDHTDINEKLRLRRGATRQMRLTDPAVLHMCCGSGIIAEHMHPLWPTDRAVGVDDDAAAVRRWDSRHPNPAIHGSARTVTVPGRYDIVDIDPYGGAAHIIRHCAEALEHRPKLWCVTDGAGHHVRRKKRPWLWNEMRMGAPDSEAAMEQRQNLPAQMCAWMVSIGLDVEVVAASRAGAMWYIMLAACG